MKKIKLKIYHLSLFFVVFLNFNNVFSLESSAKNVLLIDYYSNQILFAKNERKKIYPASMSKLMTLYILFDSLEKGIVDLDDKFSVSRNAYQKEGSTIYAELGTEISVKDLIRGIVVSSGNDACIIVAEALSGSELKFASQMNLFAKEMGLENSNFTNSSGLHDDNHFTTAEDLVKLATHVIRDFPEYYQFFKEKNFSWNNITQYNRNNLLGKGLGIDGLKTGYTSKSGYGIIVSSKINDRRLIALISGLNSVESRTNEIKRLINYGYKGFKKYSIFKKNQIIDYSRVWKGKKDNIPLVVSEDLDLLLDIPGRRGIKVEYKYIEPLYAPVNKGEIIGSINIFIPGKKNTKLNLMAGENSEKVNFFSGFMKSFDYLLFKDE